MCPGQLLCKAVVHKNMERMKGRVQEKQSQASLSASVNVSSCLKVPKLCRVATSKHPLSFVIFFPDYLEQVETRLSESSLESPSGQQREETPASSPALQTHLFSSPESVHLKRLSVSLLTHPPGCKRKGENVIFDSGRVFLSVRRPLSGVYRRVWQPQTNVQRNKMPQNKRTRNIYCLKTAATSQHSLHHLWRSYRCKWWNIFKTCDWSSRWIPLKYPKIKPS